MGRIALCALLLALSLHHVRAECPEVVRQYIVKGQEKVDRDMLAFSAVISDATGTCTATVINERYLLTAAHCDYRPGADVRVGAADRTSKPVASVISFTPHPLYSQRSILHDIAIVEIAPPLPDAPRARLHRGPAPPTGLFVRAAGYGVNTADYRSVPNNGMGMFRRVDLPIVGVDACARQLKAHNIRVPPSFTADNYVCAGFIEPDNCGGDTCNGDSGGPLCVRSKKDSKYVQLGITSAGSGCGDENVPGLYTNIAGHSEWIESTVKGKVIFADAFAAPTPPKTVEKVPEQPKPAPPAPKPAPPPPPVALPSPPPQPDDADTSAKPENAAKPESAPEPDVKPSAPDPPAPKPDTEPAAPESEPAAPEGQPSSEAPETPASDSPASDSPASDSPASGSPASGSPASEAPATAPAAESDAASSAPSAGGDAADTGSSDSTPPPDADELNPSKEANGDSTATDRRPADTSRSQSRSTDSGGSRSLSNGAKGALIGVFSFIALAVVAGVLFFAIRARAAPGAAAPAASATDTSASAAAAGAEGVADSV